MLQVLLCTIRHLNFVFLLSFIQLLLLLLFFALARFNLIWFDSIYCLISYFFFFPSSFSLFAAFSTAGTSALKSFVYSSGNQKVLLSKKTRGRMDDAFVRSLTNLKSENIFCNKKITWDILQDTRGKCNWRCVLLPHPVERSDGRQRLTGQAGKLSPCPYPSPMLYFFPICQIGTTHSS